MPSFSKIMQPCFCYCIFLQDNVNEGDFIPAYVACWNTRGAGANTYVVTMRRFKNSGMMTPIVTTTPDDVYDLAARYRKCRFSVYFGKDEKGKDIIKSVYPKGILCAVRCNEDLSFWSYPIYYICDVNADKMYEWHGRAGNSYGASKRASEQWRESFLKKEAEANDINELKALLYKGNYVEMKEDSYEKID